MEPGRIDTSLNESENLETQRIRHSLSSGLSFVETAVRNISSERPNMSQALRLHAIGTQKLREAMSELDRLLDIQVHKSE